MKKLCLLLAACALLVGCASMPKMYAGVVGQTGLHKGAIAADVGDGLEDVINGGTMGKVASWRMTLLGLPIGFTILYGEQDSAHTELRIMLGGRIF